MRALRSVARRFRRISRSRSYAPTSLRRRLPKAIVPPPNANAAHAANLRGKLLLAHGSADNNVPPYGTMLLVNELIRNNKDFDLLLLPDRRHGFGSEPYMMRRRWDYFVRHLLQQEPPAYELRPPGAPGTRPAS